MTAVRTSKLLASLAFVSLLAGCAASEPMIRGLPPVAVTASGETAPVGTGRADAAEDPAIWVDPANPGRA
ncbi:MAG: phytase, partial [Afipia sp.]|nr:phytase [Afipia sp.]